MAQSESHLTPFILLTDRLIIVPTPIAVHFPNYITLYGGLHANEAFCSMAFGPHFAPRTWSPEETRDVIVTRDIGRCWKGRGMGDFAVALRTKSDSSLTFPTSGETGRSLPGQESVSMIDAGDSEKELYTKELEDATWVGYAGVRDATTTSMPALEEGDAPLPPWEEMVELRYGVNGDYWGKGIAAEAARAVMQWAGVERGVRRFIAETERTNVRSGRVLGKMGFRESGTRYWKEDSEVEWERVVG